MLKNNSTLENVDLRWNKLGNQGAKTILKGLNLNKSMTVLDLGGNRVTDEVLRQLNDYLTRNKNGEPIAQPRETSGTRKSYNVPSQGLILNKAPSHASGGYLSPKHEEGGKYDFDYEREKIEEKHLDLARELDEETRKRCEVQDQLERIRDEYYKKDLEDSRQRSELQARIEQLESEKHHL